MVELSKVDRRAPKDSAAETRANTLLFRTPVYKALSFARFAYIGIAAISCYSLLVSDFLVPLLFVSWLGFAFLVSFHMSLPGPIRRSEQYLLLVDILVLVFLWYLAKSDSFSRILLYSLLILCEGLSIPLLSRRLSILSGWLSATGFAIAATYAGLAIEMIIGQSFFLLTVGIGVTWVILQLRAMFQRLVSRHRINLARRLTATRASMERADFLANINHELRTPLNGILGMSNLLLESSLDTEQFEYAKTIRSSAELLVSLINDILDMSRIESKTLRHDPKPFFLRAAVDNVVDALEAGAHDKRIFLTTEYDEHLPTVVLGDQSRLMQIMFNLIGNAIKFTNRGGVSLRIETADKDHDDKVQIRFKVTDTGIGIQKEVIPFIFDRYRQAHKDIQSRFGGNGLGLSITQQLVQHLGGTVSVESIVGEGSSFTVTLPFLLAGFQQEKQSSGPVGLNPDQENEVLVKEPVARTSWKPQGPPNAGPEKKKISEDLLASAENSGIVDASNKPLVLIADDNPTNLQLLSRILQKIDCSVISCDNGIKAFAEIRRWRKDGSLCLAILDYQMPGLNGADVVASLRQWEKDTKQPTCPVMILTGHGLHHIEGSFTDLSQVVIYEKPVRIHELRTIVAKYDPRQNSSNSHL